MRDKVNAEGRFQSVTFRRLVIANSIKLLTLSVTGIIDTVIVGRYLGADGLSAMRLAMPVFSILALFSLVLSSGLTVLLSHELAAGNRAYLNRAFRSVMTAGVIISALCMLTGIAATDMVTRLLSGSISDQIVFTFTSDYIGTVLIGALPVIFYDILGSVALLEGADRYILYASTAILIADIAGDLAAVVTGTGMLGIAAASVFAYLCSCAAVMSFFIRERTIFSPGLCIPDMQAVMRSLQLGIPAGVNQLCYIIWPVAFNYMMLYYGTVMGLAALSVQDAVRYIPEALVSGIGSAALILTGIFSSEQDCIALKRERSDMLRWSLIGCTAAALLLIWMTPAIVLVFADDLSVKSLSVTAVRSYMLGVPFGALNYSAVSYLQGMGKKTVASMGLFIDHLLLPLILGPLLGSRFGQAGIFYAFPACEVVMSAIIAVAVVCMKKSGSYDFVSGDSKEIVCELRRTIVTHADAAAASEDLAGMCSENGVDHVKAQHLALCCEELADNSIEHGSGDGKEHQIELRALITNDALILRLRDDCRKFDLTERYKMINPNDPAENIGLRIVFESADDVSYSTAMDLNNICIKISL